MSKNYGNKIDIRTNSLPRVNKFEAADFNEIASDIEGLDQSITNLASIGAGYWFNGTSDKITTTQTLDSVTSISVWIKLKEGYTTDIPVVCSSSSSIYNGIALSSTDIFFKGNSGGTPEAVAVSFANDYEWHHVAGVADGVNGYLYIDGLFAGSNIGGFTHFNMNGNYEIGHALGNPTRFFEGQIKDFKIFNTALTATEVKNLYSGKDLDYKYIGASQIVKDESDFSSNDDNYEGKSSNIAITGNVTQDGVTETLKAYANVAEFFGIKKSFTNFDVIPKEKIGKAFSVTFDYWADSSCGVSYLGIGNSSFEGRCFNPSGTYDDVAVVEGSWQTGKMIKYVENNSTEFWIYGYTTEQGTTRDILKSGKSIWFKNIKIKRIGNVAEYSPEGVGNYSWMDNSGNDLHGTVDGAIPTNLKIRDRRTAYLSTTSTSPAMLDVIPAGWKVNSITIETAQNLTDIDVVQETSNMNLIENKVLNNGSFTWRVDGHNVYNVNKNLTFTLTGNGGTGTKIYVELEKVK